MATKFLHHPVILVHGFSDTASLSGSWKVVENLLVDMGVEFFTPNIPPLGSIEERSASLIRQISAKYPGKTVHLFGHSMGGINSRDLAARATKSDIGFKIKTVTTFATPHRGVRMIDVAPGVEGSSEGAVTLRGILGTDFAGFGNLTYTFMKKYNSETANNPEVKYFSWAGEVTVPASIFAPAFTPSRLFGPTDCLVNVDSAVWGPDLGPGTHLGTHNGADHPSIINKKTVAATIPHIKAVENGETAPVLPVDNNLIQAVASTVGGTVNTTLSPSRAILGAADLRF